MLIFKICYDNINNNSFTNSYDGIISELSEFVAIQ